MLKVINKDNEYSLVNNECEVISTLLLMDCTNSSSSWRKNMCETLEERNKVQKIYYLTNAFTKEGYRGNGYSKKLLFDVINLLPKNSLIFLITSVDFLQKSLPKMGFKHYLKGNAWPNEKTYFYLKIE
jgi:hypothetical protein